MNAKEKRQATIAAILATDRPDEEKVLVMGQLCSAWSSGMPTQKDDVTVEEITPEEVTVCGRSVRSNATDVYLVNRGLKELTHDDVAALAKLPQLECVRLDFNQLTAVPPDLFAHNPALKVVWLNDNALASLPADLFKHNPLLERVAFSYNAKLERVPIAFYRLWPQWTSTTKSYAGRQDVANFAAAHPAVLDLPLEVPVPTAFSQ